MSRYIDANNFNKILCELIEDHRKEEFETDHYYYLKALVDLREILKKMPTANVEEVRHASIMSDLAFPYCSSCLALVENCSHYCKWCGAKLDGGTK